MTSSIFLNAVVGSILFTTASVSSAETYAQFDFMNWTLNSTVSNRAIQSKPSSVGITLGLDINPNLSVEAMLHSGLSGNDTTVNGATQSTPVETKIDYLYALAVKPRLPLNDHLTAFTKLALGSGKVTSSAGQYSSENTGSRTILGLGIEYDLGNKIFLSVGYNLSNKQNSANATGIYYKSVGIGVGHKF